MTLTAPVLLRLVFCGVRTDVVDGQAGFGDVALLVVSQERQRVAAEGDVLRSLPFEDAGQRRGVAAASVVTDQTPVDLQRYAKHPLAARGIDVDRERSGVAQLVSG